MRKRKQPDTIRREIDVPLTLDTEIRLLKAALEQKGERKSYSEIVVTMIADFLEKMK